MSSNQQEARVESKKGKIFDIAKIKNKKIWTKEEDEILIYYASLNQEKHWEEIASHFNNKTSLQCFSRYNRIRPGIIRGKWTKEEDDLILQMVKVHGKSWSKIAKLLKSRNGKQIRDRYLNALDPQTKKGKFSKEEDELLIKLYKEHGPKWSKITQFFPDRTTDMIKNRFHSSIKNLFYFQGIVKRHQENISKNKKKEEENFSLSGKGDEISSTPSNSDTDFNSSNTISLSLNSHNSAKEMEIEHSDFCLFFGSKNSNTFEFENTNIADKEENFFLFD